VGKYLDVAERLAESDDPIARYKTHVHVLGRDPEHAAAREARRQIPSHPVVVAMLDDVGIDAPKEHAGFSGSYMTLKHLADVEYPTGDESLVACRDHVYAWLRTEEESYDALCIKGKYRAHGSFHGNAIYASIALGLANRETDRLCESLLRYQWPGGGWNCSKLPKAEGPSIVHTAYGMRGLVAYQTRKPSPVVKKAIEQCAEVLLERHVHRGRRNEKALRPTYEKLTYPHPHLYGFMAGLHILARAGYVRDPRCVEALDLLERKFIPGHGWPMERQIFKHGRASGRDHTSARWEKLTLGKAHLLLTADALEILRCAGRL